MRQPQKSRTLVVSFEQLKKLEQAGIALSFSFFTGGLYVVHRNIKQCKAVLKNG